MSSALYFDDAVTLRYGYARVPKLGVAAIFSLLLHIALLISLPPLIKPSADPPAPPPMTAYLQQAPVVPPQPEPAPPPPRPRAPAPPAVAAKPRPAPPPPAHQAPAPPVIALPRPAPEAPVASAPLPPKPASPPVLPPSVAPPAETDLTAYIAARQRARGEISPEEQAAADANRANRGVVANATLKAPAPITFQEKRPVPSGGLFEIRRRGYDYAEFMFLGWNANFRRTGQQLFEVRKGNNPDIDLAVVRKIIEIIREHERGDFQWYSRKTGKEYTLSARARDNGILEDFMMQEFYDDLHRYR